MMWWWWLGAKISRIPTPDQHISYFLYGHAARGMEEKNRADVALCSRPTLKRALLVKMLLHSVRYLRTTGSYIGQCKRFCSNGAANDATNSQKNEHFDIVIAGGGMVGTTMACSLARNAMLRDKKILLLEASPAKEYRLTSKYSNRVSALSEATISLMMEIDAWPLIEAARYCPVKKMQVWETSSEAVLNFNNPHLDDPIAYIVENDVLLGAVTKILTETNASVKYGTKIESCNLLDADEKPKVTLSSGEQISCSLLA
ncbi:Hypothetical predicted protein [Cloeon dipterum]|uniref:FAD dependent oxidoreductase domain-containing protein n=1 Tax=Cloeon dipterum TaxID=197152 RepID=A0A8S1BVP9_9INSE|nr:Hypothetical predicted protein [Cloeon dipterum]